MKADSFLRALRAAGADAFDPAINAHHKTARVRVQLFVLWRLPALGAWRVCTLAETFSFGLFRFPLVLLFTNLHSFFSRNSNNFEGSAAMLRKSESSVGKSFARAADTATWKFIFELFHFSVYVIPLGSQPCLTKSFGIFQNEIFK